MTDVAVGIVAVLGSRSDNSSAEILSMWVAPGYRGTAIGSALLGQSLRWAGSQGYERAILSVAATNFAAIAFYEKFGFTVTGRSEPMLSSSETLALEMALTLMSNTDT